MQLEFVATDGAPAAIGPYSQAVRAGGWLYCSGQVALAPGAAPTWSATVTSRPRPARR